MSAGAARNRVGLSAVQAIGFRLDASRLYKTGYIGRPGAETAVALASDLCVRVIRPSGGFASRNEYSQARYGRCPGHWRRRQAVYVVVVTKEEGNKWAPHGRRTSGSPGSLHLGGVHSENDCGGKVIMSPLGKVEMSP